MSGVENDGVLIETGEERFRAVTVTSHIRCASLSGWFGCQRSPGSASKPQGAVVVRLADFEPTRTSPRIHYRRPSSTRLT